MNDDASDLYRPIADTDAAIAGLVRSQGQLSRHVDRHWDELSTKHLAQLLALHGRNAARLGRLLRERRARRGQPRDLLEAAIDQALAELGDEWGLELLPPELRAERDAAQPQDELDVAMEGILADLSAVQARLARHLDRFWADPRDGGLFRLLAVYSQNATRLYRLLHTWSAPLGRMPPELAGLVDGWVDEELLAGGVGPAPV